MSPWRLLLAVAALALGVAAVAAEAPPPLPNADASLEIRGSGAMGGLARAVVEQYLADHPGQIVTVQTCGAHQGLKGLVIGTCGLAMGTDEVPEELEKLARDRGVELKRTDVYKDALAVVVHPDNPVRGLTLRQIRDVFRGAITNWSQVGGPDQPIAVFTPQSTSATYEVFKKVVLGPDAVLTPKATVLQGRRLREGLPEWGIAYAGAGQAARINKAAEKGDAGTRELLHVLTVDGVAPSTATIQSGTYPIVRHMSLYQRAPGTPLGDAVIKYFLDPEKGRKRILEDGNVPMN